MTLLKVRGQELKLHACLADSRLKGIDDHIHLAVPNGFEFQKGIIEDRKRLVLEIAESIFDRSFHGLSCTEENGF